MVGGWSWWDFELRRNGINPRTDPGVSVLNAVHSVLVERLPFPVGDAPSPPHWCDFGTTEKYHDAVDVYRDSICEWLISDQTELDRWLSTGRAPNHRARLTPARQAVVDSRNREAATTSFTGWAAPPPEAGGG